jgi:hypothetical protein
MPLANPKSAFITCFWIVLKKNTNAAPRAVIAQVPIVARKARKIGLLLMPLQYEAGLERSRWETPCLGAR